MSISEVAHSFVEFELSERKRLLFLGDSSAGIEVDSHSEPVDEVPDARENHSDRDEENRQVIEDEGCGDFQRNNSDEDLFLDTEKQHSESSSHSETSVGNVLVGLRLDSVLSSLRKMR